VTLVCVGLAGLVIVLYGAAIWRCLCRESLGTVLLLGGIVLVALVLRLVPRGYPWLCNEDEPHILYDAVVSYRSGEVWRLASFTSGPPALLQILFGAQLYEWGSSPLVAMRAYSIGCSVLSCIIGYGVARAMRLSVAAGVLVAAAYAVAPWALLYGRTALGGEVVLHTGLVVLGISEALWSERLSRFAVLAVGAGLLLLLYDYYAGRTMLYVAMLTVPFMRWRRAVAVGTAISVAMLLYVVPVSLLPPPPELDPGTSGYSQRWIGISPWKREGVRLPPTPVQRWPHRLVNTLRAFTGPYAEDNWMTVSAGAWHPPGTLVLVLVGLLLAPSWRHRILLSLLCLGGLVPAVIGYPHWPALFDGISTHRLLIAFAGIPLCVACAVEALPSNKVRLLLVGAVLVAAGGWSTRLYFSDVFWTPAARRIYGDYHWRDIDCRGRRTR
jgi:hypothetical protein